MSTPQMPPAPGRAPAPSPDAPRAAAAAGTPRARRDNALMRYGCMVVLIVFMLIGLMCSGLLGLGYFAAGPGLFLAANVLALLTAVPYGLFILWLDRNEKEPAYLVLTALLWGAAVATVVSMIVNDSFAAVLQGATGDVMIAQALTASLSAPFIEELSKGVAVLFIFLLFPKEFDNVLDGVIYGALVGLGFATIENVIYYFDAGLTGGFVEMLKLTWVRGLLGGIGSHAAYTAITGVGFGLVRVMRHGFVRWTVVPIFWGLSMAVHFGWNTFCGLFIVDSSEAMIYLVEIPIAVLVLEMPFVALLAMVIAFVWRHENKLIVAYLQHEPADVVTDAQRTALVPARRRVMAGFRRFFARGPGAWWHHRKLDHELIQLAFVKWHHHRDHETTWHPDQDADVLALRARIRDRRGRLG